MLLLRHNPPQILFSCLLLELLSESFLAMIYMVCSGVFDQRPLTAHPTLSAFPMRWFWGVVHRRVKGSFMCQKAWFSSIYRGETFLPASFLFANGVFSWSSRVFTALAPFEELIVDHLLLDDVFLHLLNFFLLFRDLLRLTRRWVDYLQDCFRGVFKVKRDRDLFGLGLSVETAFRRPFWVIILLG
jgi:hypothetical protein